MAEDEFAHFLEAQKPVYDQAVAELSQGQKQSHWMWFVFPQIKGLGLSPMAQRFALPSLDHARRYLAHAELGARLRECTRMANQIQGRDVSDIFSYPDDLKFHSSMTLFALAAPDEPLFAEALAKYFEGQKDLKTLALLRIEEI
jgi:uncharacterized protein (DUF1810 family)